MRSTTCALEALTPTPMVLRPRTHALAPMCPSVRCQSRRSRGIALVTVVSLALVTSVGAAQSGSLAARDSAFFASVIRAIADTAGPHLRIDPRLLPPDSSIDHLSPNEREDLPPEASALVVRLLLRENIPVGNLLEAPRCPGVLAPPVPPRAPGDCPEKVHTVAAFSTPWSTLPDRERTVRVIVLRVGPAGRSFVSFDYIFVRRDLNWNLVERRFRVIIE